ncbi:hypothetical protein [Thermicanus aegyptius]|uniref:hypothetical protein n=1 Tax=Thermicanus aegyptius TaxID=94009 RepID=UPI00048E599D|nr:hypothetical protein [Thermicanus aegyptius]
MPKKCDTCVKAWRDETGKIRKCLALQVMLGKKGECFAYSDDPNFWEKIERDVELYMLYKGIEKPKSKKRLEAVKFALEISG